MNESRQKQLLMCIIYKEYSGTISIQHTCLIKNGINLNLLIIFKIKIIQFF